MIQRNRREAEAGVMSRRVLLLLCVALLGTCLAQAWCGGRTLERILVNCWGFSKACVKNDVWKPGWGEHLRSSTEEKSKRWLHHSWVVPTARKGLLMANHSAMIINHWASRNDARAGISTQITSGWMGGGNVKAFLIITFSNGQLWRLLREAGCFSRHLDVFFSKTYSNAIRELQAWCKDCTI